MDKTFRFLTPEDAAVLRKVLSRRDGALLSRIDSGDAIAREDAEAVMNTLSRELVENLDADWEPTEYGLKVSHVMARFNARRIEEWP